MPVNRDHLRSTQRMLTPGARSRERARLVVLSSLGAGSVYPITGAALVGRGEDVDVQLIMPELSRQHLKLEYHGAAGWTVEDLDSTNGTWLDGVPVVGHPVPLLFGARLQLGSDLLMVFTHHDVLEEKVLQAQKLESLGRLAGEMAQDMRSLLAVYHYNLDYIRGAFQEGKITIKGEQEVGQFLHALDQLSTATRRSGDLTSRLFGFAKPSNTERRLINISKLVEDVVKVVRESLPSRISVEHVGHPAPLLISAEGGRIHQALMNLCLNARDAMPGGGVLRLGAERFRLDHAEQRDIPLPSPADYVRITVQDSGCGMSKEVLEKIFEPFFTTKNRGEGTGLGLSTVYRVVREHGGHVSAESSEGEGALFVVLLPLAMSRNANLETRRLTAKERTDPSISNSILVLHPGGDDQAALEQSLSGVGLPVFWATTGAEGIRNLEQHRGQIALILMDGELKDMLTDEIAPLLKRLAPEVPVVLLHQASEERGEQRLGAGVDERLPCPFDSGEFNELLVSLREE